MKEIRNRLVLVTGGASGIGRLMALDFARRGARTAVWDLNAGALKDLERQAAGEGLLLEGTVCDVSDRNAVYARARELTEKSGPPDILINSAGIVSGKTLLETEDEKIERTIQVNVLSLFWTARAFLPAMIEKNRTDKNSGHIVTIASAAGLIGVRGLADYCASKFAAVGFDESLRTELRRLKSAVKTTVVCPFFIDTGMFGGVKTRFPRLLPILKAGDVSRRIVRAVLKNKKRLIMPPFAVTVLLLRVLPPGLADLLADMSGINRAMDEFRGKPPGKTVSR